MLISTADCRFDKATKTLVTPLPQGFVSFPKEVDMVSHHTGKIVTFVTLQPGDKGYDEDHWDGEMQGYKPKTPLPNVQLLMLGYGF